MAMPPHPYGVEPEGNILLQEGDAVARAHAMRREGLGFFFARLDDNTILKICGFMKPAALGTLAAVSDVWRAFANFEEVWKTLVAAHVASAPCSFRGGSWKATFRLANVHGSAAAAAPAPARARTRGVSVFSDALFLPHQLTYGPNNFCATPRGPPVARIRELDLASFAHDFEAGAGKPVILEEGGRVDEAATGTDGSIGASSSAWDEAALRTHHGAKVFHAGGVNFRLADYLDYARDNRDDQPLYLFDPTFGATAPALLEAYEPPVYFRDDLFSLLDEGLPSSARPDYRWLLIGGARSGQSWHKDPNMASAWNLTLRGRKRWLFFPPHVTPPGVFPTSHDGGHDYVTPIALAEWARDHYAEACRTPGFVEAETGPGDVTYVPRGWWHMVLNVAPLTVAVSHHFLSPAGLHTTLRLLRETPWQVSGIDRGLSRDTAEQEQQPAAAAASAPGPAAVTTAEAREAEDHAKRTAAGVALHDHLVSKLRARRPEALEAAEALLREQDARREQRAPPGLKALVAPVEAPSSFSFGFG